jgi:hypothetical protein
MIKLASLIVVGGLAVSSPALSLGFQVAGTAAQNQAMSYRSS